MQLKLLLFFK